MADFCGVQKYSGSLSRLATCEALRGGALANRFRRPTHTSGTPAFLANKNGPETALARCRGLTSSDERIA